MSKVQTLRAFVNQRLSLAAEEIFELFERTIAEYEEQLCRQNKLLDAVFKPQLQLHRADVQLLLVSKDEDPPEQQDWSSSLDQEDPPELPHIKEEQDELWTNQKRQQLQFPHGPEETDVIKFTFTPVSVKSEEDEEMPQSSQLHQSPTEEVETEADREDFGGPEPATDCDPECAESFGHIGQLQTHGEFQTGLKPFSCSVCGKKYPLKNSLTAHMRIHSEEKSFSCPICKKTFQWRGHVVKHMRVHTGEKPFSCYICGRRFAVQSNLPRHMRVHTGEKPFTCSVCKASFSDRSVLSKHMRVHTREKPFSCSACGRTFAQKGDLTRHLTVHTGEKPFGCSVCGKGFTHLARVKKHKCVGGNGGSQFQHQLQQQLTPTESQACLNTDLFKTEIQIPN